MGAGNGDVQAQLKWQSDIPENRIAELVSRAIVSNPYVKSILISSEVLGQHAAKQSFWNALFELSADFDVRFKVVMYLRDPFDWFISVYKQAVSCNGFRGELDDFVNEFLHAESELTFNVHRNINQISEWASKCGAELMMFRYEDSLPSIEKHFFIRYCIWILKILRLNMSIQA